MDDRNTIEQLQLRLQAAEEALKKCERLAVASRYAGAIMHEVNNPLEALTNLVFLTREVADDPDLVRENMAIADKQLANLGNITRKTPAFIETSPNSRTSILSTSPNPP